MSEKRCSTGAALKQPPLSYATVLLSKPRDNISFAFLRFHAVSPHDALDKAPNHLLDGLEGKFHHTATLLEGELGQM